MEIKYTFKHMQSTESITKHIEKRSEKVQKLVPYPLKLHAILSVDKNEHYAELVCHAEHHEFVAHAKSSDLYESVDLAVDKLCTQLKKDREKRKGHKTAHQVHRNGGSNLDTDLDAEIPHRNKVSG